MITAIGNNFGAGEITFKAYSSADILVLNGKVDVDVSAPEFVAASQLEIYLPNQPMRKSAETAVYMLINKQDIPPFATIIRCRLKNSNTLVIEKCSLYQNYGNFSLLFCCAMVPKGEVGPFSFEGVTTATLQAQSGYEILNRSNCVVREHWAALFIEFSNCYTTQGPINFYFQILGLPDDIEADVPIISYNNEGYDGNPIMIANVVGPQFSIISPNYEVAKQRGVKFIKAFFVRGDNA